LLLNDSAPLGHPHSVSHRAGGVRYRATLLLRCTLNWIFCCRLVDRSDRAHREVRGFVWYMDSNRRRHPWFFAGVARLQKTAVGDRLDIARVPGRNILRSVMVLRFPQPSHSRFERQSWILGPSAIFTNHLEHGVQGLRRRTAVGANLERPFITSWRPDCHRWREPRCWRHQNTELEVLLLLEKFQGPCRPNAVS